MKNSLEDVENGTVVKASIRGDAVIDAVVSRHPNTIGVDTYLCQDSYNGYHPAGLNLYGKVYAWAVGSGSEHYLSSLGIKILEIEKREYQSAERDKVLEYINRYDMSPLYFTHAPLKEIESYSKKIYDSHGLNSLVCKNIELMLGYGSHRRDKDGSYILDTPAGRERRRSVLDIWRHCIVTDPEITIFQVMNSLYHLVGDWVFCQAVCQRIHRRVFFPYDRRDREYSRVKDEFGLYFKQWKDIDKTNESMHRVGGR